MKGENRKMYNTKKVMSMLEILENDEQTYAHKPRHQNKNKTTTTMNERRKQKNVCRHHRHPNARHKWRDCICNPKSKNYCRHTGKEDKKQQEENHQTRQITSKKRASRSECKSHQDSSSLLDNSEINSSASSIKSNYVMEDKNTNQTKTILSTEVLLLIRANNKTF